MTNTMTIEKPASEEAKLATIEQLRALYVDSDPNEVNLIGCGSDEYVVLVDNTYVSSFAYNILKYSSARRCSRKQIIIKN